MYLQLIESTISKSGKSPYLASVISIPKYLLKCLAISSVAQPKIATEGEAIPIPSLE